ncbi:unnamed protein product [Clonostachys byssicola]|uniref:tetrahydrofolate synthase n=1 Tax=Clonostachys byssicola TaxID=160290 RepID=A0A9N9UKZ0_9HYPO|nr:unnamed protein product [Clonostachys byssicola]
MRVSKSFRQIDRSYKSAIELLNSRRRSQRPDANLKTKGDDAQHATNTPPTPGLKGTPSIVGMENWLLKIGHSPTDIDKLNIIHVAGTKGKGSTCAFTESFLRTFGQRTGFPKKTGLYTSPHLMFPEERIRINFQPLARDLFAKYFFEVWNALSSDARANIPRTLQLFALMAFHVFIREGVEAAIIETHHGGEYDATNFIHNPVVTAITTLGMDHVKQLGPTLGNIAWHKAGIMKRGAPLISAPQEPTAVDVIRERALEKGVDVYFAASSLELPSEAVQLRLDVQRTNSSVALVAARRFLEARARKNTLPLGAADIKSAIDQFSWPGRFQYIQQGPYRWYLDGAHNEMSVDKAAEWYIQGSKGSKPSTRVLIFSQASEARNATEVLDQLATALRDVAIDHVIFTTYSPDQDLDFGSAPVLKPGHSDKSQAFGEIWKKIHGTTKVHYEADVPTALDVARQIGAKSEEVHTLITGSQYLVGAALYSLQK